MIFWVWSGDGSLKSTLAALGLADELKTGPGPLGVFLVRLLMVSAIFFSGDRLVEGEGWGVDGVSTWGVAGLSCAVLSAWITASSAPSSRSFFSRSGVTLKLMPRSWINDTTLAGAAPP